MRSTGRRGDNLIIGMPKEIKDGERRVALLPDAVAMLVANGNRVCIETSAGAASGFLDSDYQAAGAEIVATATLAFNADLAVKVKEIQPSEAGLVRPDSMLFCFLLLHANHKVAAALIERRVSAIAFEAIQDANGDRPVLAPMSAIAGQLAVPIAAHWLMANHGGRGVLMRDARVVIFGAGAAGAAAAVLAQQMGAHVNVLSRPGARLDSLAALLGPSARVAAISDDIKKNAITGADVVIGAINQQGGAKCLTRADVRSMGSGAVLIDIGIDGGGISETSRETTLSAPTYTDEGVVHYCVANMPAAVPRSASQAISSPIAAYVASLARDGFKSALKNDAGLLKGLQLYGGQLTNPVVAKQLGRIAIDVEALLFTC